MVASRLKLQIQSGIWFGAGANIEITSLIAGIADAGYRALRSWRNHGDRPDSGRLPEIPRTAARLNSSIQRPSALWRADDAFCFTTPKTLNLLMDGRRRH